MELAIAGVDTTGFQLQVQRYVQDLGLTAHAVITTQGRLLFEQLMKFTAPKSYAQGRRAIARDITRAMTPLDPAFFRSASIRRAIEAKDLGRLEAIRQRIPGWAKWRIEPFSEGLHRNTRDARGRVQRSRKVFVLGVNEHKRYVTKMQKRAGLTKAQWSGMVGLLGGKVPAWVATHSTPYATLADFRKEKDNPHVSVSNRAHGVMSDPQFQSLLQRAILTRTIAMTRDVDRRLRLQG